MRADMAGLVRAQQDMLRVKEGTHWLLELQGLPSIERDDTLAEY